MAESIYRKASLSMIPYGAKEDVLPSIKPTDGSGDFTFSRNADIQATRVNASGLIEKAKVSLFSYNTDFTNAVWTKQLSTIVADQIANPINGATDADLFYPSNSGNYKAIRRATPTNPSAAYYGISIYAKAQNKSHLHFVTSAGTKIAAFNLSDGSTSTGVGFSVVAESLANDWYRCSVSAITEELYMCVADGLGTTSVTANGTDGIYIWGLQLEYGVTKDFIGETTTTAVVEGLTADLPRLDYSGGASCPSLLLEPSRTNAVPHSEYFGAWTTSNCTLDFGYLAPDGTNSAYKVTDSGSGNLFYSGIIDANHSRTIYARTTSGTGTAQLCSYFGNTNNTFTITDEWQRFEVSTLTTATGDLNFYAVDFRGAGTLSEIIIWGAQAEASSSYPTSYIPTYGEAANRGNENVDLTSASAIIGQTEGVMFMEYDITNLESGYDWFGFNDNTTTNRLILGVTDSSTQGYRLFVVSGGTTSIDTRFGNTTAGGVVKVAVKYDNGSYKVFVNGSEELSTTGASSFASTLTDIDFNDSGTLRITEPVKQFLVFPTALTDAECIALTTI